MKESSQVKPAVEEMAGKSTKLLALRNEGPAEQFVGQVQKKTGQLKKIFANQMRALGCAFLSLSELTLNVRYFTQRVNS